MPIGDIFRLSVVCGNAADGSEYINVHHFQQQTPDIGTEPGADLADAYEATIPALYTPLMSNITALTRLEIRQVGVPTYVYERTLSGYVGGNADNLLPPTTAPLISWRTGLAGRSYRGRTFMFPTTEAHNDRGLVLTTYLTSWAAWADGMISIGDGVTTPQYFLGIYSPTLTIFNRVITYLLRPVFARQKNRQIGEGS